MEAVTHRLSVMAGDRESAVCWMSLPDVYACRRLNAQLIVGFRSRLVIYASSYRNSITLQSFSVTFHDLYYFPWLSSRGKMVLLNSMTVRDQGTRDKWIKSLIRFAVVLDLWRSKFWTVKELKRMTSTVLSTNEWALTSAYSAGRWTGADESNG